MNYNAVLEQFSLPYQPMDHQRLYLERFAGAEYAALNAEMGTGKTFAITLDFLIMHATGAIDSVVIIAPTGVHTNWVLRELPKMMPRDVLWKARGWNAGANKAQQRHFEELYKTDAPRQLRIAVFNWEALQNRRPFEALERFVESGGKIYWANDESDNTKNTQSMRYKNLMALRGYTAVRRNMTGTPINNGPFDAFAQYHWLKPKDILGTASIVAFRAEYAVLEQAVLTTASGATFTNPLFQKMAANGVKRMPQIVARDKVTGQPKYRNLDKLNALLAPHTLRVLKKDCLDLPEKVYTRVYYELSAQQRAAYRLAEEEAILVYLNDEVGVAKLNIHTKLAQITSGYYIHPLAPDEGLVRIEGSTPKLDALREQVELILAMGHKVVIWAQYHAELDDVARVCSEVNGAQVVQYHGRVPHDDRVKAIDAFQTGAANVFVGQQKAGGSGITLTAGSYMIYFSNTFSLRDRLQSEDRIHRIGQAVHCTYIDLVAAGTVSEKVIEALVAKQEVADLVNGDGSAFGLRGGR